MRLVHTLTRGVALVGVLTLVPASVAAAATGNSAAATGGNAAAASGSAAGGGHSGKGENTPLHLQPSTVHHVSSSGGSGILRMIVALVIVIALIYAVARILKAVKGREQRASGEGLGQIATLPLGPNKSVALVRSGTDIVLVGVAESGVTPIKTYTEAEALANGIISAQEIEPAPRRDISFEGFLDTLRKFTVRA